MYVASFSRWEYASFHQSSLNVWEHHMSHDVTCEESEHVQRCSLRSFQLRFIDHDIVGERGDYTSSPAGSSKRGNSKTTLWGRLARRRLMEQLQEHPLGSTRPLAFDEAASRSPATIDSLAALASNEAGDARAWLDTPQPTRSTECEKGWAEVLGTFSARAHLECKVQCGE